MKNMKVMAAGMCLLTVVSCQTKQGTGSLIGGGAGAALGGIVGQIIGHNGKSTAIGAAITWTKWHARQPRHCRMPASTR